MNRRYASLIISAGLVAGMATSTAHAVDGPEVQALTVENQAAPIGIDNPHPSLSWQLSRGAQTAYELRVGTWDSGRIATGQSTHITYAGPALRSRERVDWQVRVWDAHGEVSPWSAPSTWEMGLLNPSDWSASWIGNPAWQAHQSTPAALPVFAKQFTLTKPIRSARLYATGLGVYAASVNGQQLGPAVLEPGNTDYRKDVQYRTYDVTGLLRGGGNSVAMRLGNGIYNVQPTPGRYAKFTGSQGTPRLLAQLEITYADGTGTTVTSDPNWRTALGRTTTATWYGGEDYDARRLQPGWDQPGADLTGSAWTAAAPTGAPASTTRLVAHAGPPIQEVGRFQPRSISQPKPGVYVVDLGVNFAGWEQLRVSGPAGTKVTMRPGELLNSNGTVSQSNSGTGTPIYDSYTLSGNGTETWHPEFAYHGFRYLEVTGLPRPPAQDTVTGIVLRAANPSAGSFTSSNTLVNNIHTIIDRAVQSNMQSIVTDCPSREKLGWLEDGMTSFDAIADNYDVSAYAPVLVRNMAEAQTSSGLVPDIAPEYTVFGGAFRDDPNWGDAMILLPWALYQRYGDTDTMRTYYPNMVRYLNYLTGKATGDLLAYGLGDWGAVDTSTPTGMTAGYAYYQSASTMKQVAAALGMPADAARFGTLAGRIAAAINAKYLNTRTHTYANGTQADDALALDMGIVPAEQRQAVLSHLVNAIAAAGNHVNVGEVALTPLFHALQAGGRDDMLYTIATQTTFPSYGFLIAHGATALTEFWAGPTGANSQNHEMLGGIDAWFTSGLAGIQQAPGTAGYGTLVIRPAMIAGLGHVAGSYQSPHGEVDSAWTRQPDGGLRMDVTIPGNSTATVYVPAARADQVTVTGDTSAVIYQGQGDGYVAYRAEAGRFGFIVGGSRTGAGS